MSNADQQHRSKEEGSLAAGIQVITRAAPILRALHDETAGLSLAQIAERVGLPRSTVQRIVTALSDERLLMTASPDGRVRLGPGLLALAAIRGSTSSRSRIPSSRSCRNRPARRSTSRSSGATT